jgi:hypothetical protein
VVTRYGQILRLCGDLHGDSAAAGVWRTALDNRLCNMHPQARWDQGPPPCSAVVADQIKPLLHISW